MLALPPCSKSLIKHTRRAHASAQDIPEANDGHGWHECDGTLQLLWTEEEEELTLPVAVIIDIIAESDFNGGQESNIPSDYDSDTDFDGNENDLSSKEDEYVWKF